MNEVQSAVTDVALSGNPPRVKARRVPAASVAAPTPPAAAEKPVRGRGRQPVFLKGGKPLKEARDEAKAVVASAKLALKNAKAAKTVAAGDDKAAVRALESATKELGRVTGKPLPNKVDQKAALTNAKAAVNAANAHGKTTYKAFEAAEKAVVKATAAVGKAEEARLKIEAAHVAAKHPAPLVN